MLNERPLVLEGVTLGEVVEFVVEVLVDLAAGAVLDEQAAEDPLAAHPQNLPVSVVSTLGRPPILPLSIPPKIVLRAVFGVPGRRYVLGHTGIGGTVTLTETAVATDPAGEVQLTRTRARVHGDGLLDDEAIGDELADGLPRVGVGDLADLAGVEPDLALTDAQDGRRKPLLGPQVNPTSGRKVSIPSWYLLLRARWRGVGKSSKVCWCNRIRHS